MFLSLLPPTTIHVQCHPQGLPAPLRPRQAPTVLVHPHSSRIAPITCPTQPPSLHQIPRLIQLVSSQPRMCHLIPLTNTFPCLNPSFTMGVCAHCDCTVIVLVHYVLCCYCVLVHCTIVILVLPVHSLVEQWLHLSVSGQDCRVSHCSMSMLEESIRKLCDLTNRDFQRYLLRSKGVLASNIGDIFRCTLCGMLGKLRPHALHSCLPFVRDSSFKSFDPSDLDCAMKTAFGDEIFCSLIDATYNSKASNMARLPRKDKVEGALAEWPQLISDDVTLSCIQNCFNNTVWKKPPTLCSVCTRSLWCFDNNVSNKT